MPYQPRATFDNPYGPQISFRTEDVLPPSAYYVALDDSIVWNIYTNYAPAIYYLVVRMLSPQGTITFEERTLNSTAVGTSELYLNLTGMEGYLLSACVSAPGVPLSSAYVTLTLMRSPWTSQGITTALLSSGYVSDTQFISYPTTVPQGPLEGPAQLKTLSLSPAAGQDWAIHCPTSARWQIMNALFSLTTSAQAGTRQFQLVLTDANGLQTALFTAAQNQAAGTQEWYSMNPGGATVSNNSINTIGASTPLLIENGGAIGTQTVGMLAGDQYTYVRVQVQEWVGL